MKTILTLEVEYEVDGEMPPLEQIVDEIVVAVQGSIHNGSTEFCRGEGYEISITGTAIGPTWLPCDADNPPPAEIPDGMLMAVWTTERRQRNGLHVPSTAH